jgi:hypothetical protein
VSSRFSSPSSFSYGRLDRLFRRFEATIPLERVVCVKWRAFNQDYGSDPHVISYGVPYLNKDQVIYLKRPNGALICIPKGLVLDITSAEPAMPKEPMKPDDPKFTAFHRAAQMRERVRIEYLVFVTNDPALGEQFAKSGLPTTVEGLGLQLTEDDLTIELPIADEVDQDTGVGKKRLSQVIKREVVLDITLLGPVSIKDPQGFQP